MAHRAAPAKVANTVSQLLQARILKKTPVWLRAVQRYPPGPSFVRAPSKFATQGRQPFESSCERDTTAARMAAAIQPRRANVRRASNRPPIIVYPEDALRRRFYREHPFELSRPRILVERDGHNRRDWTRLCETGESPTGEHVVQYQLYLVSNGMPIDKAYAKATSEFYAIRAREETERRIAEQEALHFGAAPFASAVQLNINNEEVALANSHKVLRTRSEMRQMQNAADEQTF